VGGEFQGAVILHDSLSLLPLWEKVARSAG
jgi:hypothetical protein